MYSLFGIYLEVLRSVHVFVLMHMCLLNDALFYMKAQFLRHWFLHKLSLFPLHQLLKRLLAILGACHLYTLQKEWMISLSIITPA